MQNIVQQYLPQIKELMQQYGVQRAFAFGSSVKNTMNETSDVDFIICFPDDMDYETYGNNYFDLARASEELLKKQVYLITERTNVSKWLANSILWILSSRN